MADVADALAVRLGEYGLPPKEREARALLAYLKKQAAFAAGGLTKKEVNRVLYTSPLFEPQAHSEPPVWQLVSEGGEKRRAPGRPVFTLTTAPILRRSQFDSWFYDEGGLEAELRYIVSPLNLRPSKEIAEWLSDYSIEPLTALLQTRPGLLEPARVPPAAPAASAPPAASALPAAPSASAVPLTPAAPAPPAAPAAPPQQRILLVLVPDASALEDVDLGVIYATRWAQLNGYRTHALVTGA